MAVRKSVVLTGRRDAVVKFLTEFDALLALCEPRQDYYGGSMSPWRPKPGRENEVMSGGASIDRLTGPAARALQSVGAVFQFKPAGTMQTQPANPVLLWSTLFAESPMVSAELVYRLCNQAIGLLEEDIDEAVRHESSFEGKVERVVGTPWRLVRAAFGRSGYAPATDAIGTVVVTVVGGLIVAYVAHLLHWV
jgi:hypothetical protein